MAQKHKLMVSKAQARILTDMVEDFCAAPGCMLTEVDKEAISDLQHDLRVILFGRAVAEEVNDATADA
jgi:hypothetical protein